MTQTKTVRRSPQFWQEHIRHWLSSGLMQKDYCHQNALSPSTFRRWKAHYCKGIKTGKYPQELFISGSQTFESSHSFMRSKKIWLCTEPANMNLSYTGLLSRVNQVFKERLLNGHAFVFINRRKTQIKILYFEHNGYCIWSKHLEQGQFHYGIHNTTPWVPVDVISLQMILDGIECSALRRYKRYKMSYKASQKPP